MKETEAEERSRNRAAFEALVAVCEAHRDVWCRDELSNQAMSRLFNSVELLGKLERELEAERNSRSASEPGMWRVIHRLDVLYDRVDQLAPGLEAKRQLPARADIPLEGDALLVYAERVVRVLERYATDLEAVGIDPDWTERFASAIRYAQARREHAEREALTQPAGLMHMYQRQLNACLRMLLERVDPVMPRYREHAALQEAYREAREGVAALCIGGRQTTRVDGLGQVSGSHRDALTPWPAPDGSEVELPTSDELHRELGLREDEGDGDGREGLGSGGVGGDG